MKEEKTRSKRRIRIGQFIGKALVKPDSDRSTFRLLSASRQCFRIRVKSGDLRLWMSYFDQGSQCARATANVENSVAAVQARLVNKWPRGGLTPEKVYQRILQTAVFLSGNGPLVEVLRYALESKVFVQDVHGFLNQYGGNSHRRPEEHI